MSFVLTNRILDDSVSLARTFYVDQLKRVLRGMRLPIQGNKSNLRERLFNHISALRIQLNIPASKITAQASLELFCQLVSPDLITPVINHAARPPVINNMPTPQVFNPIPVVPVISFDINKISFQKSPFYEFVATLSPLKLMDSTVFKNAFRMDFILSQERINQIIKKEISIVLLAATISVKNGNLPVMPTGPVKIMYPGCQLFDYINTTNTKPLDISRYVQLSVNYNNRIEFKYQYISKFAVSIGVIRHISRKEFIEKLREKSFVTKAESIKRIVARNVENEDIQVSMENVSLMDPLTMVKISVPSRSLKCNHLACFDLATYLDYNETAGTWKCTICSTSIVSDDLIIDGYFDELVKLDTESIDILPDGTYEIPKVVESIHLARSPSPELPASKRSKPNVSDVIDLDSFIVGRGNAVNEVIDLTADSDDEGRSRAAQHRASLTDAEFARNLQFQQVETVIPPPSHIPSSPMFSTPPDSSTAPKNLPAKRIRSPFQEPAHSPRRAENQPITSNGSPPKTDISAVIPTPATQQLTQAHESLISRGRKHEAVTEAQESIERFYGIPNGSSALAEFFKHHSFQDLHKDLSLESQSAERSPIAEHNKPRFDSNAMSNFSVHQRFYNTSFSLPTAQRDPTPPIQSNSLVFGSSAITAPLLTPNLLEKPFLRVFGSSSPEKTAQVSLAQSKNSPVMFGVNSMPNISKFVSSSVPAFNSQPKSAPSESNPHDNSELVASESNMLVFGSPAIIPPRPTHSLLQTPFARVFGSPQVSSVVQHLPVEVGIVNTPNVSRIPPKSPSVDSLSEGFKADLVDDLEVFESSLAASSLPFNDLDFDEDMREEDLDLEL